MELSCVRTDYDLKIDIHSLMDLLNGSSILRYPYLKRVNDHVSTLIAGAFKEACSEITNRAKQTS